MNATLLRYTALYWIIAAITFFLAPSAKAGGSDPEHRLVRIDVDSVSKSVNRYKIVPYKQPARKSVGLALSGGGSRGLSQIGVLKALDEHQIPIDFIAGTSIGSIVGGLYSAGYNATDLENVIKTMSWSDLTAFTNTTRRRDLFLEQKRVRDRASVTLQFDGLKLVVPQSLSTAQPLAQTLDLLTLNAPYHASPDFNSLPVPFRAVATDLITGKRIVLKNQSLSEAMRSSATIPFIFSPVKTSQYELVDGGLVSNLPTDILDDEKVDLKIAVNTMGTLNHTPQDLTLPWKAADQVFGILMQEQNQNRLGRANVVITPPIGDHETIDFSKPDTLIAQGYMAGTAIADSIKRLVQVQQTNDTDVRACTKRLSGSESLSDSLSAMLQRIVESGTYAKATLAALLETDYLSDAYAELSTSGKMITYHIKPLPKFNAVKITGSNQLRNKTITDLFNPLFGKNYTNREGTAKLESLIKAYREKGYCLIHLTSVNVARDSLFITTNGDKLSSIEIQRSRRWTKMHVIDREITFDTTRSLKYKQVETSISQLYNMSIFSRVSMWTSYKPDSTGTVSPTMVVRLDERLSEMLRFGFRIDDVYSSQFLLDFRNENFLGLATELGGWTTVGPRNFSAQIEFRAHRLWSTYLTFFTRLFYEQRDIYQTNIIFSERGASSDRDRLGEYGQQFYGASAALGGQVSRDGQAIVEILKQNAQVYPSSFNVARENLDLNTLRLRFTLDTRNDPVDANTGTFMDIYYDMNPKFLGNDVTFSKIIFNYEDNFPITEKLSWRLKLNLGVADNRTPLSQQFSLGGISSAYSTTFYGLRLDDYRGRQLTAIGVSLKLDLPVQIVFPTSFGIHFNTGNVWPQSRTLMFRDFIHGVGASLSLRTPIGPAQLSVSQAFKFGKNEESTFIRSTPPVYYFVLGYEF